MGVDGFCAVGSGTPWYDTVRDFPPTVIEIVDGVAAGRYAVLDRCPIAGIVDVFHEAVEADGTDWSYDSTISEVENAY